VCKCLLPPGDNPIAVNKTYHKEKVYKIEETLQLKQKWKEDAAFIESHLLEK